jgi:hypothetical protein
LRDWTRSIQSQQLASNHSSQATSIGQSRIERPVELGGLLNEGHEAIAKPLPAWAAPGLPFPQ